VGAVDRRLIAPMILGAILHPINSSMIAVALVPIGMAFGAPPAETAWLVGGLYVATAIGQPVVGRLVDGYGPRRLFLIGTALVGAAGVLGVVSPQLWVLVVARVLLGFGTCAGYPAAMYLIRSEADRTGQDSPAAILTLLAISTQTIAVIGPTLGGLLVGLGGWRSVFAVNVPLAVLGFVLGALRLPRAQRGARADPVPGVDLLGITFFAAMLVALLLFLMDPARWWLARWSTSPTRTPSTTRPIPSGSARPPVCCARSSTSGRSCPRPRRAATSATAPTHPGCTTSRCCWWPWRRRSSS
jgi:MFS family permease